MPRKINAKPNPKGFADEGTEIGPGVRRSSRISGKPEKSGPKSARPASGSESGSEAPSEDEYGSHKKKKHPSVEFPDDEKPSKLKHVAKVTDSTTAEPVMCDLHRHRMLTASKEPNQIGLPSNLEAGLDLLKNNLAFERGQFLLRMSDVAAEDVSVRCKAIYRVDNQAVLQKYEMKDDDLVYYVQTDEYSSWCPHDREPYIPLEVRDAKRSSQKEQAVDVVYPEESEIKQQAQRWREWKESFPVLIEFENKARELFALDDQTTHVRLASFVHTLVWQVLRWNFIAELTDPKAKNDVEARPKNADSEFADALTFVDGVLNFLLSRLKEHHRINNALICLLESYPQTVFEILPRILLKIPTNDSTRAPIPSDASADHVSQVDVADCGGSAGERQSKAVTEDDVLAVKKCAVCGQLAIRRRVVFTGEPYCRRTLQTLPVAPDDLWTPMEVIYTCQRCFEVVKAYHDLAHMRRKVFLECASELAEAASQLPHADDAKLVQAVMGNEHWIQMRQMQWLKIWDKVAKHAI